MSTLRRTECPEKWIHNNLKTITRNMESTLAMTRMVGENSTNPQKFVSPPKIKAKEEWISKIRESLQDQLRFQDLKDTSDQEKEFRAPKGNIRDQSTIPKGSSREEWNSVDGRGPNNQIDEYQGTNPRNGSGLSNNLQNASSNAVLQTNGGITANQIASRHVIKENLPIFNGDSSEWLLWHHQYESESKLCGYSNGENLKRLNKSLKDKANKAVEGFLIHPAAVPWIIETLKAIFGRPELIIKTIIQKIRNRPADNLEDLINFAFEATTTTTTIELLERPSYL